MESLCHELEERSILQPFQLCLLTRFTRSRSDKIFCFRWNGVIRERFRNLIEKPLIDRSAQRHQVRSFVGQQRLTKKFAHLSIDFAGTEIVVIEKDLEPGGGLFIIIGKRHHRLFLSSLRFGRR